MTEKKPLFSQFDLIANSYDTIKFVQAPAQKVVQVANISKGDSVLDIACGSGWLTIPAAQVTGPTGYVHAIDIAPQMITLAQTKAAVANVDNIEFSVMNGQTPEFEDGKFDVIMCGQALFAFPDIKQALINWRRCLKEGGRVVFSSWGKGFLHQFSEMLFTRIAEVTGEVVVSENVIKKLDSIDKCQFYLEEANYTDISVSLVDMSYFHSTVESYWDEMSLTVQGMKLNELTPEQQKRVCNLHLEDVNNFMTSNGIKFEVPVIISLAHK